MFKFLKRPVFLGAIRNAINAKITLEELSEEQKISIYAYANALYISGGRITNIEAALEKVSENISVIDSALDRMSEYEINALYSMAMMECGVEPKLPREGWNVPPSNPLALVTEFDKQDIETAISYFWDKYRLKVNMRITRP